MLTQDMEPRLHLVRLYYHKKEKKRNAKKMIHHKEKYAIGLNKEWEAPSFFESLHFPYILRNLA